MLSSFITEDAGHWHIAALLLLAFISYVFADGFRRLSGANTLVERKRALNQSDEDWLMGASANGTIRIGTFWHPIRTSFSAAAVPEWEASETYSPPLVADGVSHLYGYLGRWLTGFLFRDVTIRPPPIEIEASPSYVWSVLIDFDSYAEWNPFHRKVEIVTQPRPTGDTVAVRMTVKMGGLLGTLVSTETIYYCDSKRHILAYGIGRDEANELARRVAGTRLGSRDHSLPFLRHDRRLSRTSFSRSYRGPRAQRVQRTARRNSRPRARPSQRERQ